MIMEELNKELNKYMISDLSNICIKYFSNIYDSMNLIDQIINYVLNDNYIKIYEILKENDEYFFKQNLIDTCCKQPLDIKIIKTLDRITINDNIDWEWSYMNSCTNRFDTKENMNLIEYIVEHKNVDLNDGLTWSCEYNRSVLCDFFIKKGATICYHDYCMTPLQNDC